MTAEKSGKIKMKINQTLGRQILTLISIKTFKILPLTAIKTITKTKNFILIEIENSLAAQNKLK